MEDHQLGREQQADQRTLTLSVASQAVLERAVHRAAVIFNPPSAGDVTLSLIDPAATGIGLTLRSTDPPIVLNVVQHGALVTSSWQAVASAGSPTFTILESYLPR